MNRVIKNYSKLHHSLREEIYEGYSEGDLERTSFPYQGKLVDGVIYKSEDCVYLVPISTIVAGRSGSSDDIDDDDDESSGASVDIEESLNEE